MIEKLKYTNEASNNQTPKGISMQDDLNKPTEQPESNQSATHNPETDNKTQKGISMQDDLNKPTEQPESNQSATHNPETDNKTQKGTTMQEEQKNITEQPAAAQDSAVSTQKTDGATENISPRPTNRSIASVRTGLNQKRGRRSNIKNDVAEVKATLKRGYHKVEVTGRETPKIVYLDSSEREYLKHKMGQLLVELFEVEMEIKEYDQELKSLASRSNKAHKRDLNTLKEDARVKRVSNEAISKLKQKLTKETLPQYPTLASLASTSEVNQIELENFFSKNLSAQFEKFKGNPKISERVFDRSIKYIQKISK